MDFKAIKGDTNISFKLQSKNNFYVGKFIFNNGSFSYQSIVIQASDEWSLMRKLVFEANSYLSSVLSIENINLVEKCWDKFFDYKQQLLNFEV